MRQKINKTANRREITSIKKAVSYLTCRDYTIILSTKPFVSVTGNKKIDDIPQTGGNDNQWIKEFPSTTQISKYIQYSSRVVFLLLILQRSSRSCPVPDCMAANRNRAFLSLFIRKTTTLLQRLHTPSKRIMFILYIF